MFPVQTRCSYYGQKGKSSSFQNVLILGVLCFIIYVIYKSCMTNAAQRGADGYTDIPPDDPTSGPSGRRGFFGGGGSPPPPGFRPDYHTDASEFLYPHWCRTACVPYVLEKDHDVSTSGSVLLPKWPCSQAKHSTTTTCTRKVLVCGSSIWCKQCVQTGVTCIIGTLAPMVHSQMSIARHCIC